MTAFISNLVGNDYLATLIVSFIPLIELKGGIIFARGAGLGFFYSFLLAYAGSTLVFIPVFFLLQPILNLLKKIKWFSRVAEKAESYVKGRAETAVNKRREKAGTTSVDAADDNAAKNRTADKAERRIKLLAVFIFVAIPLPMTGVWTGTAVAVFLGLKFKDAILPVVVGNFIAGAIISGLAELCIALCGSVASAKVALDWILYGLFALAIIMLAIMIIKIARQKPQDKKEN